MQHLHETCMLVLEQPPQKLSMYHIVQSQVCITTIRLKILNFCHDIDHLISFLLLNHFDMGEGYYNK